MKHTLPITFFLLLIFYGCKNSTSNESKNIAARKTAAKPIVSFTFDDGSTMDIAHFKFEKWNEMLLSHLENEHLKAVFLLPARINWIKKGNSY